MTVRRTDAPSHLWTSEPSGPKRDDARCACACTKPSGSKLDAALERAAREREAQNRPGPPRHFSTRTRDGAYDLNELSEHARATLAMLAEEKPREGTGAPWNVTPAAPVNGPPSISRAISPYYRPAPTEPGK